MLFRVFLTAILTQVRAADILRVYRVRDCYKGGVGGKKNIDISEFAGVNE